MRERDITRKGSSIRGMDTGGFSEQGGREEFETRKGT